MLTIMDEIQKNDVLKYRLIEVSIFTTSISIEVLSN